MSSAWRGGSTRAWRKVRAAVLKRDGHTCQLRLDGCTLAADCVHHLYGRAVTGDDPAYLVASCRHCNLVVGEPAASRATRIRRPPSQIRRQQTIHEWHPRRW